MTNHCGSCTMCCKIMGVDDLPKPMNTWCTHVCKGKGCGIYDSRPRTCAEYECVWLTMKKEGVPISDKLRPDKSKIIINSVNENETVMNVLVDPGSPHAWKDPDTEQFLARICLTGIRIVIGIAGATEKVMMEPRNGAVTKRTIHITEPDENGVQWYKKEKSA